MIQTLSPYCKSNPQASVSIVGNKCDSSNRQVEYETGKQYADSIGALFMETSAKDSTNVQQLFTMAAQDILEKMDKMMESGEEVVGYVEEF